MERNKRGRYTRRSVAQWTRLVSEQAGSGLSQRRFCERQGLSYSSFRYWKQRLARSGGGEENGFIELAVEGASEERQWDVELTLGEGVVLRVRRR